MALSGSIFYKMIMTLAAVLAACAAAGATDLAMPTGGITTQPFGHHQFCRENPQLCENTPYSAPLVLSQAAWRTLQEVNTKVNTSVIPRTDMQVWGRKEVWSYPTKYGDCEDYVLEKQRELARRGISASNLLITVVRQANGDGHAVLTVRTNRGDYILDNIQRRILLWTKTDYHYLKRQSELNAGRWVSIEDDHSVMVGSIR